MPDTMLHTGAADVATCDTAAERLRSFIERVEAVNSKIARKQSEQRELLESFAIENREFSFARDKMGRVMANPLLRALDFIEMDLEGCWNWIGVVGRHGYGMFCVRKVGGAHRWFYEAIRGPIAAGLHLDHLCRNRACVNPWHLEPVTPAENVRRGISPRVTSERMRAKTHCPHGHPYSGDNLYIQPSNGARLCRACSRRRQQAYENRFRRREAVT